ncbi:MAG: DUF2384 domain-containing protein [Bacteroidetes bacterium]|nr:DUF2384 domain-containing protein [Bacteroidota bacterium]
MESIVNDVLVPYQRLARFDNDPFVILSKIHEGVTYEDFESVLNTHPFSITEWAGFLHVSERTLLRYKVDNKRFDEPLSERIIQIHNLYKKGLETFGEKENLDIWLNTKNIALGGLIPKSLFNSSYGIEILSNELTRISYGVFA